ncbi:ABC transporter substrate-binding protein [Roseibium sp. SCP14]|uniref:ABC transporter substrate-binding protein n=1 Tax=Roseibium sp. SCP14 TaxID=3141375 RepID=UPI00333B1085
MKIRNSLTGAYGLRSSIHDCVVALILAVAAFTLVGASVARADDACPKYGGTFKTVDISYSNLDPSQVANPQYYMRLLYDGLLDFDHDLNVVPGLAVDLPTRDGERYVFKLRDDVKFHDGSDFNAEAVKFNVERLIAGEVRSPLTGYWKKQLKSVEVIDDHTVAFVPAGEWPTMLWDFASSLRFASPAAVKELGVDHGLKGAVGTGPFMFKSFQPKNLMILERNPNYYKAGLPCLDGIQARVIKSGSVRALSLIKGDLDMINTFPETQFPQFQGSGVIIDEGKSSTLTVLAVNTKNSALADLRVRQAIQHAVDGKELIDNVYAGMGEEIASIFPSWHPAFTLAEELSPVRQDVEKAKALLADAGYGPGGKKLTLQLLTGSGGAHTQRAILLQAQLADIGIDLKVKSVAYAQVLTDLQAGNYELILWQMLGGPAIIDYAWNLYGSGGPNNFTFYNEEGGYQNPRAEELTLEIAKSNEPNEVRAQIIELQDIIFNDVPVIFLNWRNHRTARTPSVKDLETARLKGMEDLRKVWLDR